MSLPSLDPYSLLINSCKFYIADRPRNVEHLVTHTNTHEHGGRDRWYYNTHQVRMVRYNQMP